MSHQDDIRQQIAIHDRRLQILKQQQAAMGISVEPKIVTEIEDIEAELKVLKAELEAISKKPQPPLPGSTINPRKEVLTMPKNRCALAAIIGFLFVCSVAIILTIAGGYFYWSGLTQMIQITARVTTNEGEAIPRAKVLLFYEGVPYRQLTDSNGVIIFDAASSRGDARLIVEKEDYQIYEEIVSLSRNQDINILIEREEKNNRRIIIRVVDDNNSRPVEGAEVLLFIDGNIYEDATDSNGLSRFTVEFVQETIDVEMQVTTNEYDINTRTITLQPDRAQDIRLNPLTEEFVEVTETEATESNIIGISSLPPDENIDNIEGIVEVNEIPITPISESEPNNSAEEAQEVIVGMSRPVNATLTAAPSEDESADQDWYRFTANAGEEYIVEIFDVANTLALVPRRYNCEGTATYSGLRLIISDPSLNEVSRQCTPTGAGNVHTIKQFTAGVNGDYYLQVVAHSPAVEGGYSLRILPKYGQENANWDTVTFEPNNRRINAYPILPGWENALQSIIEPRSDTYSTNRADIDSYRFEAIAGQSYVVELLEVSNTLSLKTRRYNCGEGTKSHTGLWLGVFDPIENEVVRQCTPTGAGDAHNTVEFTAGNDGTFHIMVFSHEQTVAGSYTIRVLPKHDEPNAGWDSTSYEPNNRAANAYPLEIGEANALSSAIETRNEAYSTNRSDRDWYYFTAEAGQTYRVELFDVDDRLELASYRYNCGEGTRGYTGLLLGASDTSVNEITRQCTPNGEGSLHSFIEFTASRSETHYIWVLPHESALSGEYSIRIFSK